MRSVQGGRPSDTSSGVFCCGKAESDGSAVPVGVAVSTHKVITCGSSLSTQFCGWRQRIQSNSGQYCPAQQIRLPYLPMPRSIITTCGVCMIGTWGVGVAVSENSAAPDSSPCALLCRLLASKNSVSSTTPTKSAPLRRLSAVFHMFAVYPTGDLSTSMSTEACWAAPALRGSLSGC